MRLIDADARIEALRAKEYETVKHPTFLRSEFEEGFSRGINIAKEIITAAPTIEAEPVRRGKWVKNEEESANHSEPIYRCSACLNWEAWGNYECTSFCPHCGAKMEVENAVN